MTPDIKMPEHFFPFATVAPVGVQEHERISLLLKHLKYYSRKCIIMQKFY